MAEESAEDKRKREEDARKRDEPKTDREERPGEPRREEHK
jgi:hypothetical protein